MPLFVPTIFTTEVTAPGVFSEGITSRVRFISSKGFSSGCCGVAVLVGVGVAAVVGLGVAEAVFDAGVGDVVLFGVLVAVGVGVGLLLPPPSGVKTAV